MLRKLALGTTYYVSVSGTTFLYTQKYYSHESFKLRNILASIGMPFGLPFIVVMAPMYGVMDLVLRI